jgi:hypothetical protein
VSGRSYSADEAARSFARDCSTFGCFVDAVLDFLLGKFPDRTRCRGLPELAQLKLELPRLRTVPMLNAKISKVEPGIIARDIVYESRPRFSGCVSRKHRQLHKVAPMDKSARIRRTCWMPYPAQPSRANLEDWRFPERLRLPGCALVRRSTASELILQLKPIGRVVKICAPSHAARAFGCARVRDSGGRTGYVEFV